jgi:hypothetical protein
MVPGNYLFNGARDVPGAEENRVEEIKAYGDRENCSKEPKGGIKKIGNLYGSRVYHSRVISLKF